MSEKLTDSRRVVLRDSGIFPRSKDLNVLFGVLGAIVGYRFIGLDFQHSYGLNEILFLSLVIPIGVAVGSIFATLAQSRFLFRFCFSREKEKLSFSQSFYSLIKLVLSFVVGAMVFRIALNGSAAGTLQLRSIVDITFRWFFGLLVLYGFIGILISRLTFTQRYQMSRSEMEADAREGEMRPEVREAMDTNFTNSRESD